MTDYYVRFEDTNTREWVDTLPEARVKAVRMLRTASTKKKKVLVEKTKGRLVAGYVFLNYKGIGVWKVGRTAWLISEDGNIRNKQPYW